MSKSMFNPLCYFIIVLFFSNCGFKQNPQHTPKIPDKIHQDIDENFPQKKALMSAVNIKQEDTSQEQEAADQAYNQASAQKPHTKKTTNKLLLNPQLLNKFFDELERIQPNQNQGKFSRIAKKFRRKTWVADWNRVVKNLKKESPQLQQKSLQIVGCIMGLSDKNPKKAKNNSMDNIISQFNEAVKEISKKKKNSSRKKIILASIKDVKGPLLEAYEKCKYEKCKKGTEKKRLKKVHEALCAFEKVIKT